MVSGQIQPNNAYPAPASYSPLSIQGHSLNQGVLTCNEGQWSNVADIIRTSTQAKTLNNFQMLTRGVWSNPDGIGWTLQRAGVFNGGAAFMDFGIFRDSQGNQTMLFQVGNTLYSYNLGTNTETAYGGGLTALSTSLVNLPTMRNFVDSTGSLAPYTIYTNGAIQPQKIVATADKQGVSTEYTIPTGASAPTSACVGPDGNIYVTEFSGNKILQIIPFTGTITEFTIPTAACQPQSICTGPDGNLWFTEFAGNKIAKMTTLGAFTEYSLPTPVSNPYGICLGPDKLIWFTENANNKVGSITTAGLITEYTIPTGASGPRGICAGPDGLLWFTEFSTNKIGKVTSSTSTQPLPGTFTEYVVPTGASGPQSICAGPVSDGRLWFTEFNTTKIGAVTTTGAFTEYTTGLTAASKPWGICLGPDQNLWFTENANAGNKIGSITPAGTITEYAIPTGNSGAEGIVAGGNSQIWYVENSTNKVAALQLANLPMQFTATVNTTTTTPQVTITEFVTPTASSAPYGICVGPDNNLWFTESARGTGAVSKLTTGGVITEFASGGAGANFSPICNGPAPNAAQLIYIESLNTDTYTSSVTGVFNAYANPAAGVGNRICPGPDGNVWFTTTTNNTVVKMTPAAVFTSYVVPTGAATPWGICAGPDGNLWFTEKATTKIGKVTTAGAFTEYTAGLTAACQPYDICQGPDGNLWFTEFNGNNIGKISTGGIITEYTIPTALSAPQGICSGPDGNIWFTELAASKIGKLVRAVPSAQTLTTQTGLWPGVFYLNQKSYSKPKYSCYFNNRQAYFGFDPSGLAAYDVLISAQGNAESFVNSTPINATDACSFTIQDLGLPTGCTAFRLANTNNQEVLVLGFQNGIAVIAGNGFSSDATTYQATILTREYGLMSNRTFTQIMNDLYFLSTNGVRNWSNLSINSNLLNSNLTYQMQDVIAGITPTLIAGSNIGYNSQAFAVHSRSTLEVQYWFPNINDGITGANFTNQHAIIMNYNSLNPVPQQLTPIFSTKSGTSVSCGIFFNGIFYGGGYDGHLQVHYSGTTYNGAAIPGQITLALVNGGNVQQSIELRQGEVITEGNFQLFGVQTYFYTKQDDNTILRQTSPELIQTVQAGVEGETIMGSWIMGLSSFPSLNIKHCYFEATGLGPYIEFDLMTNGVNQALDFAGLAYTLTVGGLRD